NNDIIAIPPRYRASNQKQILRFPNLDDLQILRGSPNLSHVTRHSHSAHDCAGEQPLTNRARTAMPSLSSVSGISTAEAVTSYHTLEASPFSNSNGVDIISRRKKGSPDDVTRFDFLRKVAEFLDTFDGDAVEFLDMAEQRFGKALLLLVVQTQLHSVVAIALL